VKRVLDVDLEVRRLLSRMTLEEKVAQLLSVPVEVLVEGKRLSREKAGELLKHGIGEVTRVSGSRLGLKPREAARLANEIQRFLVEETRLGIPAIIHEESLSGLMAPTATNFPQSIGLASTWDPELVYRVASEIRRQALLVGARQCLAPVLDVCRDPRWGRTEETYGEDPYLVAAMGVAYVRGLQSDDLSQRVIATPKHFAAHGFPEGGRNTAQVHVGVRELREVFLYPFEAAVKEGGALSVMAAYHEIDGVPCHTNYWLLTEVLRGEWSFRGFVVSDYFAIRQLITVHRVAGDELEAAIQALEAGVDVELPGADCYKRLMNAVREGVISERAVEEAAARVLRAKYLLGLFENPYVDEAAVPESLDSREARELALEAARKSIVLLKNDGTLPLPKDLRAIAVIGPNAAEGRALLGDYTYTAHLALEELAVEAVSILEGIRRRVSPGTEVLYARGCDILSDDRSGFKEAVEAAEKADVVVAVMGERSGLIWFDKGRQFTSGEGVDRPDLRLPGVQEELIRELHKVGKPIVLVLVNGRPLAIGEVLPYVNAVVEAWYPGEEGGTAVADVLFGDYNPGGKLPITFPRSVGQVPIYYSRKPSSFHNYIYLESKPLFPFGYGLSYTKFEYRGLRVEPQEVRAGGVISVTVAVRNVGDVEGDEVVQLYVAREHAGVARPVMELKGFKRVTLKPGEEKLVTFRLPTELLAFYDRHMRLVIEPGEYKVMIGRSAEDIVLQSIFRVVGRVRVLPSRRQFFSHVEEAPAQ